VCCRGGIDTPTSSQGPMVVAVAEDHVARADYRRFANSIRRLDVDVDLDVDVEGSGF
jgi:hypothetical protein